MILGVPVMFLSVVIPILISLLFPLIDASKKVLTALSTLLLMIPLAVVTWLTFITGLREPVLDPIVLSNPTLGNFSMLLDAISAPVAISIGLVTSMISVYSLRYMEHRFEEMEREGHKPASWGVYFMLYVMFSAAMMGTVLSTNLIEFYLFLEVSLLPSFLLIAFYGYGRRERIALLYLIWTHVGALAFLVGVLLLGLNAGTFDFYNPIRATANLRLGEVLPEAMRLPVFIAILIGLFVKMAVFGVHIWLPYAHAEAPTPVSALLSPNLIGIAGYALIRIAYALFPSEFELVAPYLLGLALLTIIYGGLMALAQDDFKRFLAYSSVSQMGYLLMGIASITSLGMTGALLHYAAHAVGKALLFATAGVLITQLHGLRSIGKMGGLASKMPLTAALALIGFMHITGVPPSLGLWSEILIVAGVADFSMRIGHFVSVVALLLVGIGLSTAYSFITMRRIFFGKESEAAEHAREAGYDLLGPMIVVAAMGLVLFLLPQLLIDPMVESLKLLLG
ncbi:MAG: NADH-quinone oxidoreductase subunit M [Candidatus Korarchaeum sp.]|nr:NADH-quinone oxidoreductase subunit M [Candidatus Korarchaeum sp.]MDW8036306.1 NADH-quinone oxidoreductase subunit M [Candidatus Korarchaeum sp.]